MKIGVDVGKVIVGGGTAVEDTDMFFSEQWMETPALEKAFESLAILSQEHELVIISKCGAKIQERTMLWLEAHGFFETVNIAREDVYFVRKRYQKAPLAKELGLEMFIDDREDVLSYMVEEPHFIKHRILFTSWIKTMKEIQLIQKRG